jgi:hypothetical protein
MFPQTMEKAFDSAEEGSLQVLRLVEWSRSSSDADAVFVPRAEPVGTDWQARR